MVWKGIDVNEEKWKAFGKWCVANDTTLKKEMDKILNKYGGRKK